MVTRVSEETGESLGQNIQPTFGYYRQPNGWITVSTITMRERLKYIQEGWTHLPQYGAFDMTTYSVNHPLEGLFMFGGVSELSLEQVITTGLYIDPPLVPTCGKHLTQFHRGHTATCWRGAKRVEFPQLVDAPADMIGPFPCEFCERKLPTRQAREQHQQVAHAGALSDLRTGESLGNSLAGALGKLQNAPVDNSQALLQRIAELEAEQAKVEERRAVMAKARASKKPKKG